MIWLVLTPNSLTPCQPSPTKDIAKPVLKSVFVRIPTFRKPSKMQSCRAQGSTVRQERSCKAVFGFSDIVEQQITSHLVEQSELGRSRSTGCPYAAPS